MANINIPNLPPVTIVDWLHQENVDCDENGIVYTRYGNEINLIKLFEKFVAHKGIIETP